MYTGHAQRGLGCGDCAHRAAGLGLAPLAIAATASSIVQSIFGHSATYTGTLNAIPQLRDAALQGDRCSYVVLKSLSGDQAYCREAIDICHQIGTHVGQAGPCGGADSKTKDAARAAWQAVDAARSVAPNGSQPGAGPITLPTYLPAAPTAAAPAMAGFSPIAIGVLGVLALMAVTSSGGHH